MSINQSIDQSINDIDIDIDIDIDNMRARRKSSIISFFCSEFRVTFSGYWPKIGRSCRMLHTPIREQISGPLVASYSGRVGLYG
jgi:hypothetical protein